MFLCRLIRRVEEHNFVTVLGDCKSLAVDFHKVFSRFVDPNTSISWYSERPIGILFFFDSNCCGLCCSSASRFLLPDSTFRFPALSDRRRRSNSAAYFTWSP